MLPLHVSTPLTLSPHPQSLINVNSLTNPKSLDFPRVNCLHESTPATPSPRNNAAKQCQPSTINLPRVDCLHESTYITPSPHKMPLKNINSLNNSRQLNPHVLTTFTYTSQVKLRQPNVNPSFYI